MQNKRKHRLLVIALVLLWLASMGWLIFYEAYPELRTQSSSGYRTLLSRGVMIIDRWMKISFNGTPIGYTHTSVVCEDKDGVNQYRVNSQTILSLMLMGSQQRVSVRADAVVDPLYRLKSFAFNLSSTGYSLDMDGTRLKGTEYDVTVKGKGSTQHIKTTIPEGAVIYSPMTEMTLKALKPGDHTTLMIFNPVTLSAQNVTIRALRHETLVRNGENIITTVLTAKIDGMETMSWVDGNGVMLKQQTPFGWIIESCDAKDAIAATPRGLSGDMLSSLAVPIIGQVSRLATEPEVKLHLTGASFTTGDLQSQRQTVLQADSNTVEVLVRAETMPTKGCRRQEIPVEMQPWLAATPFIQAKDQRLIDKAREITGDWTNALEAATAIYTWVYTQVEKKPTVSLPSALDVLATPQGDCNEHTYLFTGLARAAGLPCKVRVGLTLHEGKFYYHAWPCIYVGQWLDMDPTRGQPAVNAGYLSLIEGELAEQMKLMGMIGKLKVEIRP